MKRVLIKIIINNGDRKMKKIILFLMVLIIILPFLFPIKNKESHFAIGGYSLYIYPFFLERFSQ